MAMLFHEKNCKKCGCAYDSALECCPKCKEANEDAVKYHFSSFLSWLPTSKQVALGLVGSLGYSIFSAFILAIILKLNHLEQANVTATAITVSLSYFFLLVALCFIVGKDIFSKLFPQMKKPKAYGIGLGIGTVYIVVSILYSLFLTYVIKLSSDNSNQTQVVQFVKNFPPLAFFIIVIIGPICEELTYRVGMFNLFLRTKKWIAYILTAVIFGFMHFDFTAKDIVVELWNLPTYVLAGLTFAFIYERYGFAASLSAHVLNNLLSFILTLV